MRISILKKMYIYLKMKYCDITGKKMLKEYITVYKYKNKVGYFVGVSGLNKKDVIDKVRTIVYYSDFFNGIKNKKDIQVIVIEREDTNE